jgi:hypothetical protein
LIGSTTTVAAEEDANEFVRDAEQPVVVAVEAVDFCCLQNWCCLVAHHWTSAEPHRLNTLKRMGKEIVKFFAFIFLRFLANKLKIYSKKLYPHLFIPFFGK